MLPSACRRPSGSIVTASLNAGLRRTARRSNRRATPSLLDTRFVTPLRSLVAPSSSASRRRSLCPATRSFNIRPAHVGLAAAAIWGSLKARRMPLVAFGIAIIAFAGDLSGLLGPDRAQLSVRPPGTSVHVDEAGGSLLFPLVQADAPVLLERAPEGTAGGAWRITERGVAARSTQRRWHRLSDQRGAHLTTTQPTGSAFLSPGALTQSTQNIDGPHLPDDSFAVPAAHRIVKAALLSQAKPPRLRCRRRPHSGRLAFDLDDDTGASIPRELGVAPTAAALYRGRATASGRSDGPIPRSKSVPIPDLAVVAAGALAILIGLLLTWRARRGKIGTMTHAYVLPCPPQPHQEMPVR